MSAEARAFVPPTVEMRLWQQLLAPILRPPAGLLGFPGRTLRLLLVAPLAHLCWLSAWYQMYLLLIFHQRRLCWLGHCLLFPITILALCAAVAPHHAGPPPTTLEAALSAPGATLLCLLLWTSYHIYLAVFFRSLALGAIMVALGGLFYLAGLSISFWLGNLEATPRVPWIPWGVAIGSAAAVALSHVIEPDLPPAVTGTERWEARKSVLNPHAGLGCFGVNLLRATGALVFGSSTSCGGHRGSWRW